MNNIIQDQKMPSAPPTLRGRSGSRVCQYVSSLFLFPLHPPSCLSGLSFQLLAVYQAAIDVSASVNSHQFMSTAPSIHASHYVLSYLYTMTIISLLLSSVLMHIHYTARNRNVCSTGRSAWTCGLPPYPSVTPTK